MSDEIKQLEEELGLTPKVVLNPNKDEQQFKTLIDDAKESIEQINDVIARIKDQIEMIDGSIENENNRALSNMVENFQKLFAIKQKYSSHLLDILKRKKTETKVTEEDGMSGKRGLTTTELKELMEKEKRKESPVDF